MSLQLLGVSARPCKMAAAVEMNARLFDEASACGSHVVLNGDGGDQLFLRIRPSIAAPELTRELSITAVPTRLAGMAIQQSASIWTMFRQALWATDAQKYRERFLNSTVVSDESVGAAGLHTSIDLAPGANALRGASVTRLFQYFGMRNAEMNTISIRGSSVRERKVFLFWPLVRAAIQAKRQFFFQDGRDRALAREAFKNELPPEIYHRASKGAGKNLMDRFEYGVMLERIKTDKHYHKFTQLQKLPDRLTDENVTPDVANVLVRAFAAIDWMNSHA